MTFVKIVDSVGEFLINIKDISHVRYCKDYNILYITQQMYVLTVEEYHKNQVSNTTNSYIHKIKINKDNIKYYRNLFRGIICLTSAENAVKN
jgi:hypothetical protein